MYVRPTHTIQYNGKLIYKHYGNKKGTTKQGNMNEYYRIMYKRRIYRQSSHINNIAATIV